MKLKRKPIMSCQNCQKFRPATFISAMRIDFLFMKSNDIHIHVNKITLFISKIETLEVKVKPIASKMYKTCQKWKFLNQDFTGESIIAKSNTRTEQAPQQKHQIGTSKIQSFHHYQSTRNKKHPNSNNNTHTKKHTSITEINRMHTQQKSIDCKQSLNTHTHKKTPQKKSALHTKLYSLRYHAIKMDKTSSS